MKWYYAYKRTYGPVKGFQWSILTKMQCISKGAKLTFWFFVYVFLTEPEFPLFKTIFPHYIIYVKKS